MALVPHQERPAILTELVGQILDGRYRIEALLGHGGMGAVYRATHVHLEQRVAIKVLRPHLAGDPVAARRFAREAKATYQLSTPHAVDVADFGVTEGGLVYMAMEYLDGRTVHDELAVDGALAPARALRIAAQVCDALDAAHRLGFLHRDIKPDNVMLIRRGADPDFVKVLDFGLAKLIEGAGGGALSVAALTQRDMVFGTPEYMAPEQAMGHALDGRADLYAVGATLFEMLTGRPPFADPSPMKLLAMHVRQPPPALAAARPDRGFPAPLEALVARCLAKSPDGRPASAGALAAELRAIVPLCAGGGSRVPAALAASQTVDVDARDVRASLTPSTSRPRHTGRTAALAIGGAVLALGALATVAMTRSRSTSRSTPAPAPAPALAPPAPPLDAAPATVAVTVAIPDAAPTPAPDRPAPRKPSTTAAAPDPELLRHLAAAEAARTQGNRLRQLAEADAALARDRRDVRARFLMGEALLETGDVANGCKYLRSARRVREARALLASGRCPSD